MSFSNPIVNFCFEATVAGMKAKSGSLNEKDKLNLAKSALQDAGECAAARDGVLDFLDAVQRDPTASGEALQQLGLRLAREYCPGADIGMGDMGHYHAPSWHGRADLS
ncbi:MAG: hypothetical protein COB08_005575 [Rhodobacteraceae bacterium]|nr:hypothetical protein [Paracoccaceae bacterium]